MPGPFPGMDPYLEAPPFWESFHDRLIFHIGSVLQEVLPSGYVAEFRQRVDLLLFGREILPDVTLAQTPRSARSGLIATVPRADAPVRIVVEREEVRERYVEILHIPDHTVVAVLEVASPTNKTSPDGREAYLKKQQSVLSSSVHLIELDLLRAGRHWVAAPESVLAGYAPWDYLSCVSRGTDRSVFECYFSTVREPLPNIRVPLLGDDGEVPLDLQRAVTQAYDQGQYRSRLPYGKAPLPPLRPEDEQWARALLREHGLLNKEEKSE